MKLPRDCNGGEHHLSVPNHRPLKVGMLGSLLKDIAAHHGVSVDDLLQKLCL